MVSLPLGFIWDESNKNTPVSSTNMFVFYVFVSLAVSPPHTHFLTLYAALSIGLPLSPSMTPCLPLPSCRSLYISLPLSLSERGIERQVLHSQCRRLETQNYTLSLTAEQLSHSMAVRTSRPIYAQSVLKVHIYTVSQSRSADIGSVHIISHHDLKVVDRGPGPTSPCNINCALEGKRNQ